MCSLVQIQSDVKHSLGIPSARVFRSSFYRSNLFYEVRAKPGTKKALTDDIIDLINERFRGQSGIVYCMSRKDCENLARCLSGKV